ncbi:MAG TPA: ABC transporter ATP-binding protein [Candidatus Acidoferrales bacterium]|nr:ABC transporter ATP-binding protein [Candidatus Acidoferrales bacterium]
MVSQASITEISHTGQIASPDESRELLRAEKLTKIFHSGNSQVIALADANLYVVRGEMIALVGPSGSGKSTLLHLLAGLDTPTSGTVYFAGRSLGAITEHEREEFRGRAIGFIWQRHQILPDFTATENVAMPLLIRGMAMAKALGVARDWLSEVGLADRLQHRAGELSGGEQQRVAIARALVNRPSLLLADEPTGDLDERNTESIFELMQRIHGTHHLTSILATHNLSLARRADRVLMLEHGTLVADQGAFVARTSQRAIPGESSAPGGRG